MALPHAAGGRWSCRLPHPSHSYVSAYVVAPPSLKHTSTRQPSLRQRSHTIVSIKPFLSSPTPSLPTPRPTATSPSALLDYLWRDTNDPVPDAAPRDMTMAQLPVYLDQRRHHAGPPGRAGRHAALLARGPRGNPSSIYGWGTGSPPCPRFRPRYCGAGPELPAPRGDLHRWRHRSGQRGLAGNGLCQLRPRQPPDYLRDRAPRYPAHVRVPGAVRLRDHGAPRRPLRGR